MVKLLWQLGRRRLTDEEDGVSMSAALRLLGEVHSSKKLRPGLFYETFVLCKYDGTRAYFQFGENELWFCFKHFTHNKVL
jgi:hypothetical protein